MFEVSYMDLQHLSVAFEHPSDECIATVEIDLSNIDAGPKCKTFTLSDVKLCPEQLVNQIMQK
jgi:hypothetical protein